jgi:hypothetical protein
MQPIKESTSTDLYSLHAVIIGVPFLNTSALIILGKLELKLLSILQPSDTFPHGQPVVSLQPNARKMQN